VQPGGRLVEHVDAAVGTHVRRELEQPLLRHAAGPGNGSTDDRRARRPNLTLAVLGVPLVLLAVLPPAIFLMFAWRPVSRAVPTAGTACFLALAVLALAGWLVPLSSDLFKEVLRLLDVSIGSGYPPPLSPSEALVAVTVGRPSPAPRRSVPRWWRGDLLSEAAGGWRACRRSTWRSSRCSRTRSEHRSWCSNPPEIRLSDSGRASRRGRRLGFS